MEEVFHLVVYHERFVSVHHTCSKEEETRNVLLDELHEYLACNAAAKDGCPSSHFSCSAQGLQISAWLASFPVQEVQSAKRTPITGVLETWQFGTTFLNMIISWLFQNLLNPEYSYGVQGQSGKAGSLTALTSVGQFLTSWRTVDSGSKALCKMVDPPVPGQFSQKLRPVGSCVRHNKSSLQYNHIHLTI